jgi:hypothetical protein
MSLTPIVTQKEVLAHARYWVPRVHLLDWQIEVRLEPIDENTLGDCMPEFKRRLAWIRINPEMYKIWKEGRGTPFAGVRTDRLVEAVVLHELLHVVEEPLDEIAGDLIWLEGKPEPKAHVAYREYKEYMIDSWTRTLLEAKYSLGPWAKDRQLNKDKAA